MKVDVRQCARCGENHSGVEFAKLDRPIDDFTFWALCPKNGQPILLKINGGARGII